MVETTVEFDINTDDIVAYQLYYYSNSPQIKGRMRTRRLLYGFIAGLFLTLGVFFLIYKLVVSTNLGQSAIPIIFSFVMGFCFLWYYFFLRSFRKRINKEVIKRYNNGLNEVTGRHKFSITEDKIIDLTEMSESTTRWIIIEEVVVAEKHLLLIMRASYSAYIVPRNAFSDEGEFTRFADTARKYQQAANMS